MMFHLKHELIKYELQKHVDHQQYLSSCCYEALIIIIIIIIIIIVTIIIIIIITLFESQIILAEHKCCTNWGDCKSNKSNQMLVFEERGKPEFPEKNLLEQSREPTNSAHI